MAYSAGGGRKLSAVDAILAEAADLVALEQIARLNTAHLDLSSGALPSSLESRFRKLKSLPAAAVPAPASAKALARSATAPRAAGPLDPSPVLPEQQPPPAPAPTVIREEEEEEAAGEKEKENSSPPRQARPPAVAVPAAARDDDDEDLERLFGAAGDRGQPTLRERNRGRDDDDDATPSPPPVRQACCFGFSPKKKPPQRTPAVAKGKKKVHGDGDVLGIDAGEWGDENRRMVADLKEQQCKLKKALEEQAKVSRETAKMARWVKQASARMTHTAAIDDLLSDCEDDDEELK